MGVENDPFDRTIWDPVDEDRIIEELFQGPEALSDLLSIPPYERPDGSYYVFGASRLPCHTCYFDADGKPFIKLKSGYDQNFLYELEDHKRWVRAFQDGGLTPREEADYPKFQFQASPYFMR